VGGQNGRKEIPEVKGITMFFHVHMARWSVVFSGHGSANAWGGGCLFHSLHGIAALVRRFVSHLSSFGAAFGSVRLCRGGNGGLLRLARCTLPNLFPPTRARGASPTARAELQSKAASRRRRCDTQGQLVSHFGGSYHPRSVNAGAFPIYLRDGTICLAGS
jgi:hypothetical protein